MHVNQKQLLTSRTWRDAQQGSQMLHACRGLPVERLSRLQILIAYWGFGLHWGNFTILSLYLLLFLLSVHHLMLSILLIHLIFCNAEFSL